MSDAWSPAGLSAQSDAAIAAALADADAACLLMSVIHLTGDESILAGPLRPAPLVIGGVFEQRLSARDADAVRAMALAALVRWRDAGGPLPPPPSRATLARMLDFFAGNPVPPDYTEMLAEELELDGRDARAFAWQRPVDANVRRDFHVVVIGAGMSGLLAAKRLGEAGLPFTIVEKNPEVGGTWYENLYPGCRVDVGNHFYSYSFEPSHDWSSYFSERDELFAYFADFADRHALRANTLFSTEVETATFADDGWNVSIRDADGGRRTLRCNAVISAVGQLNRPKFPDIPGRESFAGPALHTAQWDRGVDLAGKRVAVIGAGASAFQAVPEIARSAAALTVFQRSAPWMKPNARYHDTVSDAKKWVLEHVPFYARWYRFLLFWHLGDATLPLQRIDPDWPHAPRSVSASNEALREQLTAHIAAQVDDPALLAKVVPDYPPGGKRMLQDNGSWLRALQRDTVELVTTPIDRIVPDGVVDRDGRHHAADAIVYGTGFDTLRMLAPMRVVGRGGRDLSEVWDGEPSAYLGITVPDFPNFFMLYGPGANVNHGGSIVFVAECQVRYVLDCLRTVIECGHATIEVRPEALDRYGAAFDEAAAGLVTAHPSVVNWFKTGSGRVVTNWPWRNLDMWRWTRHADPADHRLEGTPAIAALA